MELAHNYGFELTFHWNNRFRNVLGIERRTLKDEAWYNSYHNQKAICAAVTAKYNQKWTFPSSDQIEIHSAPLGTLEAITEFYSLNRSIADALGLKIRTRSISSGGGHLHLSPKAAPWGNASILRICKNAALRPFLSWAFCDPEDNLGSRCNYINIKRNFWLPQGRTRHIHYSHLFKTLEFRFFEAPRDLSEQLLHVQFAEALALAEFKNLRFALKYREIEIEGYDCTLFLDWSIDRALSEFERCCQWLGLNFADYEAIATRNITTRFSYGEEYLT